MKYALNYFSYIQQIKEERRRMAQNNLNNSWANQRHLENSRDQSLSLGLGQLAGTNMNAGSVNRSRKHSQLNENISQQNGNPHDLRQNPNLSNEVNIQNMQANFGSEINQRAARGMHLPHLQVPSPISATYQFRTSLNSLSISQAQSGSSPIQTVPTSPAGGLLPPSPQNNNNMLGYPSQSESVTITNPVQQNTLIAQVSGGGAVELNEGRRRGSQRGITGHQNRSFISQSQAQNINNSGIINQAHQNFSQTLQAPNLQSVLLQISQPAVSRHQSSPIEAVAQMNNIQQPQLRTTNVSAGKNQTNNGATRAKQSTSGAERIPAKNPNQANLSPQNPFNKVAQMKHSLEHTTFNSNNHQPDLNLIMGADNPEKDKFDHASNKHNQSKRSHKKVNKSQQSSEAQDHHEVYSYAQFMDEIEKEDDDFRDFMQNPIPQLALDGRGDGSYQYAHYSEGQNQSNSYRGPPRIPNMGQIFAETSQDLTRKKSTFTKMMTTITNDGADQDLGNSHYRGNEEVKINFQKTSFDDSPTIARNYIKNGDHSPYSKKAHTQLMKIQDNKTIKRRGTMLAQAALPRLNYEQNLPLKHQRKNQPLSPLNQDGSSLSFSNSGKSRHISEQVERFGTVTSGGIHNQEDNFYQKQNQKDRRASAFAFRKQDDPETPKIYPSKKDSQNFQGNPFSIKQLLLKTTNPNVKEYLGISNSVKSHNEDSSERSARDVEGTGYKATKSFASPKGSTRGGSSARQREEEAATRNAHGVNNMQAKKKQYDEKKQIGNEGKAKSKKKYLQSLENSTKPFKKGATSDGEPHQKKSKRKKDGKRVKNVIDESQNKSGILHEVDQNNDDSGQKEDQKDENENNKSMTEQEKQEHKKKKDEEYEESQRLRFLKNYDYFVILPDDPFKKKWDLIIAFMLIFTALVSPYRIAFVDVDTLEWTVIETLIDCIFGVDLLLNFFFAYYDNQDDVVDGRKKIAMSYLYGWFFIDLLTILPISQIMNTSDFGNLAKIARLPKLYRLIKVLRLMRILKVVKQRQMLIKYVNEILQLNAGFERLIFFVMMSLILCHICCCFWVILANLYQDSDEFIDTWLVRSNYQDEEDYIIYIASMYFVLTTFTTVGFGDINGVTGPERLFCLLLMIFGAISFSFSVSSLSSMLSSMDNRNANLREKLGQLNQIKRQYKLQFDLYRRIKSALKYDNQKNATKQFEFLNELPQSLKVQLAMIMHKEIMKKVRFFRNKPPHFIAFIGPLLRPLRVEGGHFVFKEGDPIEHIFFLIKGDAAYVNIHINKEQPLIYMKINPGYNFGEIDFVYSKYKNLYENHGGNQFVGDAQADLGIPHSDGPMRRAFTVQAILPGACDILTISKADLQKVEADFEDMVSELFLDSYKKIRKMLQIKEQKENSYLQKKAQGEINGPTQMSKSEIQEEKKEQGLWENVRRLETALYGGNQGNGLGDSNSLKVNEPGIYSTKLVEGDLNRIDEEDEEDGDEDEEIHTEREYMEAEAVWQQKSKINSKKGSLNIQSTIKTESNHEEVQSEELKNIEFFKQSQSKQQEDNENKRSSHEFIGHDQQQTNTSIHGQYLVATTQLLPSPRLHLPQDKVSSSNPPGHQEISNTAILSLNEQPLRSQSGLGIRDEEEENPVSRELPGIQVEQLETHQSLRGQQEQNLYSSPQVISSNRSSANPRKVQSAQEIPYSSNATFQIPSQQYVHSQIEKQEVNEIEEEVKREEMSSQDIGVNSQSQINNPIHAIEMKQRMLFEGVDKSLTRLEESLAEIKQKLRAVMQTRQIVPQNYISIPANPQRPHQQLMAGSQQQVHQYDGQHSPRSAASTQRGNAAIPQNGDVMQMIQEVISDLQSERCFQKQ